MKTDYCMFLEHKWIETYYDYQCENCNEFVPYGCEPWAVVDDYESEEYYPEPEEE